MEIINNPKNSMLGALQYALDKELDVGIVNIWASFHPCYFVVLKQGEPIAFATLNANNECPELYKLYVAPGYRKKGVAMDLVFHVMRHLAAGGKKGLFVEMTSQSVTFWEKIAESCSCEHVDGTLKLFFRLNG